MDINEAVIAIEHFVTAFTDRGYQAREVRVRPSGDDARVIKVWTDLGPNVDGAACAAWAAALESAVTALAGGYALEIRVESL